MKSLPNVRRLSFYCLGFLCRYDPDRSESLGFGVYRAESQRGLRPRESVEVSFVSTAGEGEDLETQIVYTVHRPGVEVGITAYGHNFRAAESIVRSYRARVHIEEERC